MSCINGFQNFDLLLFPDGTKDILIEKSKASKVMSGDRITIHKMEKRGVVTSEKLDGCKVILAGETIVEKHWRTGFHLLTNDFEVKTRDWSKRKPIFKKVIIPGKKYHDEKFVGISHNKVRDRNGHIKRVVPHLFIKDDYLTIVEDRQFTIGGVSSHGSNMTKLYKTFVGEIPSNTTVRAIDPNEETSCYNVTLRKYGVVPCYVGYCVNVKRNCYGPFINKDRAERFLKTMEEE